MIAFNPPPFKRRRAALVLFASLALLLGVLAAAQAPPAQALGGIESFSMATSSTQAGGHPDIEFHGTFAGRTSEVPPPGTCNCHDVQKLVTHFPTGIIGNPNVIPKCTIVEFSQGECSPDSQIGVVSSLLTGTVPLFNMVPHPNEAGLFAFNLELINAPVFVSISARTGSDYGLDATSKGIFHILPLKELSYFLWGVPAAAEHDALRFPKGSQHCQNDDATPVGCFTPEPSGVPAAPFLENPTTCGVPLTASLDLTYYDHSTYHADTPWPAMSGCDQLSFNPSLTAKPTTTQADTATGIDIDLSVPQTQSPSTPSPSEIRATTVTMPPGFSINPNAADGKSACTEAEGAFGTEDEAHCPESAKVGTLSIDSTALPGPIGGAIYLGQPQPGNPYRLFLTADGYATHVKLAGSARPDPSTGQLVVSFTDLPQTPFERFQMHFFGSERGLLATPAKCGTYPVTTEFVPWNSALPNQSSLSFFAIDSGPGGAPCPGQARPFSPQLQAGSESYGAAAHSPFAIELTRADGEQTLSALQVNTPPGFSATLKGIPYCPQAALDRLASTAYPGRSEQAAPACPQASQIGSALAGAGAGTHPLYVPGKVYLAGPYKGAPLSLVVVVPAVSGPYDLGNVAVRAALRVDPITAQVSAVSDPLPQILGGIPLRLRSVRINLDRPGFALNPTNCNPFAITTALFGGEGAQANPASHYQVANCADLGFGPKLALKLSGSMKRTGDPALKATLTAGPGEANIAATTVTMPHSLFLDNAHVNAPCTRVQYAAHSCPPSSVLGSARATSPLLDQPLEGPVYLRSSSHKLPDLVVALGGQLQIELSARIDTVNERLRTRFEAIPDVPVSSFTLNLAGAKKGLLENSENLCAAVQKATVKMAGQNGATTKSEVKLGLPCGKSERAKRAKGKGAGR